MSLRKNNLFILIAVIIVGLTAGGLYARRTDLSEAYYRWKLGPVPKAVSRSEVALTAEKFTDEDVLEAIQGADGPIQDDIGDTEAPDEKKAREDPVLSEADQEDGVVGVPDSFNLMVPFVVQAPFAEWDALHEDACEEASVIMLYAYLNDETYISAEDAEERIRAIVNYEMETLGYFESTTAEQTAGIMRDFYGMQNISAQELGSIDELKRQIAKGYPVVVPASGKSLKNPFFTNGGPDYHMLVVKGYTATYFITNDPGTKRGADFMYTYNTLWNAIHDWNGGNVLEGKKMMIIAE